MKNLRSANAPMLALSLLSIAACSTQQVGPDNVVIGESQPGPEGGIFHVAYASTAASYQDRETRNAMPSFNPPRYNVAMDGALLALEEGVAGSSVAQLLPIGVSEDGMAVDGYLHSGRHHFAMLVPGSAPMFQGDGEIMAGGWLHMYVFGAAGAQQGRFVSTPDNPSPGNESITVINLIRSGQTIEVVSCTDATTCTPISPALAMGDVFQTEVPAVVSEDGYGSLTATGAGVGYRLVPSASFPNPPVNELWVGVQGVKDRPLGSNDPAPIFISAPVFISDQGVSQAEFE